MDAPAPRTPRLGERLVQSGQLSAAERDQALALQAQHGGRLGEILVRMGALSEAALAAALAEQSGLPLLAEDWRPRYVAARR